MAVDYDFQGAKVGGHASAHPSETAPLDFFVINNYLTMNVVFI